MNLFNLIIFTFYVLLLLLFSVNAVLYSTCTKEVAEILTTFKCPPNLDLKNRDKLYCCGNEFNRYCCSQSEAEADTNDDVIQFMGTIIGYIIIGCFIFCLCNHTRKCLSKRQRRQENYQSSGVLSRDGVTGFNRTGGQVSNIGFSGADQSTNNNNAPFLYPNVNPTIPTAPLLVGPARAPTIPIQYPVYPASNLPYPASLNIYSNHAYNPSDPPPPYPFPTETKS